MKKILSVLLSSVLVLSLAACTGGTKATGSSESSGADKTEVDTSKEASNTDKTTEDTKDVSADSGEFPAYEGEAVELRFTWWGGDERAERTNKVIELFHNQYPDITIKAEPRPSDSYWDNLNTQIGGNNAPDIMQFGGNYPDFVKRDVLQELNEYKGKQLQIDSEEKFDQAVLETGSMNGNLYGVSLGTNVLTLIYNKTILETAGVEMPPESWTWKEMIEYGRKIKDQLPDGVFPFVDNGSNQANYLSYFMQQRGEPIWTAEEKSLATQEGITEWVNIWEDMRKEGIIPDIETTSSYGESSVDNSILVPGKAVFGLIWSNQIGTYQDAMTDELGLASLPTGDENALTIQVSQYLAINKSSDNKEAAALFINFFVNSEEAGKILGNDRGVSSSPKVREAIAADANEQDSLIYAYYDQVIPQSIPQGPNLPNDQEFVDNLKTISQSISFGETDREQGAKDLFDLIQRLMVK